MVFRRKERIFFVKTWEFGKEICTKWKLKKICWKELFEKRWMIGLKIYSLHGNRKLKPGLWFGNRLKKVKLKKEEFKSSESKGSLKTIKNKKDFFSKINKESLWYHPNSKKIKKSNWKDKTFLSINLFLVSFCQWMTIKLL